MLKKILIGIGLLISFNTFSQLSINTNTGEVGLVIGGVTLDVLNDAIEAVEAGEFIERDEIWAADSAKVLHFADTSATGKIATKAEVNAIEVGEFNEVDVIWAADSANVLHWADTTLNIATQYEISKRINDSLEARMNTAEIGIARADSGVTYATPYDLTQIVGTSYDSTYIHYRVDSLGTIITAQQDQIDNLLILLSGLGDFDLIAPSVDSISIGGLTDSTFICFFDTTDIHQDSIPLVGSITVTEEGNSYGVSAIDIHNDSLLVTMDSIAHFDSTYLFTYTKSLYPRLQDSTGNQTSTFANHAVTNYIEEVIPPGYPAVLDDADSTAGWYIAEIGNITVDIGIQQWNDMSINAHHLIMNTDTSQPSFANGYVTLDGSNDEMMATMDVYAQPIVVYLVCRQITFINNDQILRFNDDPGPFTITQYSDYENRLNAGAAGFWSGENTIPNNAWFIARYVFNGASSSIRVNNGSPITGTANAESTGYFQLGHGVTGANFDIEEIIIRRKVDSSTDDAAIMTYLNNNYSIY